LQPLVDFLNSNFISGWLLRRRFLYLSKTITPVAKEIYTLNEGYMLIAIVLFRYLYLTTGVIIRRIARAARAFLLNIIIITVIEGDTLSQSMNWEEKVAPALRQPGLEKPDGYCRIIVELSGEEMDEVLAAIDANQGKLRRKTGIVPALVVEVPFSVIPVLAMLREVKKIWSDSPIRICHD
jgi:hypothetical protein